MNLGKKLLRTFYVLLFILHFHHAAFTEKARVKTGITDAEKARIEKTSQAQEKLFGRNDLKIGIAAGGGGIRATIVTLAALDKLQENGLLDSVSHIMGISGGSWPLASWIVHESEKGNQASFRNLKDTILKPSITSFYGSMKRFAGLRKFKKNMSELKKVLIKDNILKSIIDAYNKEKETIDFNNVKNPHGINYNGSSNSMRMIVSLTRGIIAQHQSKGKTPNHRPYNLVDYWGKFISEMILEQNHKNDEIYLSDYKKNFLTGDLPIPVLTSAIVKDNDEPEVVKRHEWIEYSPLGTSLTHLETRIPAQALGYEFDNGQTLQDIDLQSKKEEKLGYLTGICGSCFALDKTDLRGNIPGTNIKIPNFLDKGLVSLLNSLNNFLGGKDETGRLVEPKIRNFLYNYKNQDLPTPEKYLQEKFLTAIDGGICMNIPFAPLLRKKFDVIIALNSEPEREVRSPILRAKKYAQNNNLAFPSFNYKKEIRKKGFKIISEPGKPLIIYIQNMANQLITKFDYTEQEFDKVYNHIQKTIDDNFEEIKEAIKNHGKTEVITKNNSSKKTPKKPSLINRIKNKIKTFFSKSK